MDKYPLRLLEGIDYIRVEDPVYKYELIQDVFLAVHLQYNPTFRREYFALGKGYVVARKGYRWDGASGLAIDTDSVMRASLFHDLLWQLIDEEYLLEDERHNTNKVFYDICIEDGMWKPRAWLFYLTVNYIGRQYIKLKKWAHGR